MPPSIHPLPELWNIKISGDVHIEPVTNIKWSLRLSMRYLIMGPTGAGKSTFIQALAGPAQDLSIAKDQLDGYTQQVVAYHLVNAHFGPEDHSIYLIDTPGFSDANMSEIEIIDMYSSIAFVTKILYVTPINETRLTGSKWKTIQMLKSLLEPSATLESITFVTTMWDTLHNNRAWDRAESNFVQLRDIIFKDFMDGGTKMKRFMNTRESALDILDDITTCWVSPFPEDYPTPSELYRDLHERIQISIDRYHFLQSGLSLPESQTNPLLNSILQKSHEDNTATMSKFIGQMIEWGPPPRGYRYGNQVLRKRIAAEITPMDSYYDELFRSWAQEAQLDVDADAEEKPDFIGQSQLHQRDDSVEHTRHTLALKGLLRRLIKTAKRRGNEWFKNAG